MRKTGWWGRAAVLLVVAGLLLGGCAAGDKQADPAPGAGKKVEVRCPVMGGEVAEPEKAMTSEYQGKTYYFCCAPCKVEFDANPEKYLHK